MIKEITIPEIGEKVESGQVVGILVKEGDTVENEQGIIEFETDKAVVEIPSPARGKIVELSVKEGDSLKIGAVIGKLETEAEGADRKPAAPDEGGEAKAKDEEKKPAEKDKSDEKKEAPAEEEKPEKPAEQKTEAPGKTERKNLEAGAATPSVKDRDQTTAEKTAAKDETGGKEAPVPASPSVRRLARELGVDIRRVAPSGPGGRITDEDIKHHVKHLLTEVPAVDGGRAAGEPDMPNFAKWGEIERVALSSVRSAIARSATDSWRTVPHVTQYDEADVTQVNGFLKKFNQQIEDEGVKVTISTVILKVLAAALREFPRFNASMDFRNGQMIFKRYYHLGVAVDTEVGLLVPVIRDVDKKGLVELSRELAQLAQRTRDRKVGLDELEGGTFTLSNQGAIGGRNFTPIVLWPQVAILGVSRGSIKPVFADGQFQPRQVLPLALSYDHRVVDGADAVRFLDWVARALEQPLLVLANP